MAANLRVVVPKAAHCPSKNRDWLRRGDFDIRQPVIGSDGELLPSIQRDVGVDRIG